MIIPQTTALIKASAKFTSLPASQIHRSSKLRRVRRIRYAIWHLLSENGHTPHRIATAFRVDTAIVRHGLKMHHILNLQDPDHQTLTNHLTHLNKQPATH